MNSLKEEPEGKSKKSKKEDEYDKSATVKKSKKEKNTEKESKKQSRKEKKAQEPSSNNEDPTSRKQKNYSTTGGGTEGTGGSTGPKDKEGAGLGGEGESKKSKKPQKDKKGIEHQTESARLGAKVGELMRHARTPMEDTKDDLTNRIMALSPSTTIGNKDPTDNRFITEEEMENVVDRSETVKKNKKDNDPEKLPPEKKKPKEAEKKKVNSIAKTKTASGSKSISMEKGRSAEGKTATGTGSKEGPRSTVGPGRVTITRKHVYKTCIDRTFLKPLDKLPRKTRIVVWVACAITFLLGTAVFIYVLYGALGKGSPSAPPTTTEEYQDHIED